MFTAVDASLDGELDVKKELHNGTWTGHSSTLSSTETVIQRDLTNKNGDLLFNGDLYNGNMIGIPSGHKRV